MPRISQLPAITVPSNDDPLAIVDTSGAVTSKITRGDLLGGAPLPAGSVDTNALGQSVVTPDKRSGGFKIGIITGATMNSTGNKAITGVGFEPKLVRFTVLEPSGTDNSSYSGGSMTSSAQFATSTANNVAGTHTSARNSATNACILRVNSGNSITLRAAYVSMDNDGFTINVSTAGSHDIAYEAYA